MVPTYQLVAAISMLKLSFPSLFFSLCSQPLIPSPFTADDAAQLLQFCLKATSRSATQVFCDSVVVSENFVSSCKAPFEELMQEKAKRVSSYNAHSGEKGRISKHYCVVLHYIVLHFVSYPILFYSILFCSIPSYCILFHPILIYSVLFSVLSYPTLFYSILF